jgi:hypothetical protein
VKKKTVLLAVVGHFPFPLSVVRLHGLMRVDMKVLCETSCGNIRESCRENIHENISEEFAKTKFLVTHSLQFLVNKN